MMMAVEGFVLGFFDFNFFLFWVFCFSGLSRLGASEPTHKFSIGKFRLTNPFAHDFTGAWWRMFS
jgi:hypothetical protein